MDNIVAKNQEDVEKYREKVFKSKEECRKIFAKESFEKKIKTAFELYEKAEYLKKFRACRQAGKTVPSLKQKWQRGFS